MELSIQVIDAFANSTFEGNPAAVIIINEWLSDELMQSIAAENNLSETAFVKYRENNLYDIRWFSPLTEIDFCGHATLASAFVVFKQLKNINTIRFFAQAVGLLQVSKKEDGYMQMVFPNQCPVLVDNVPEKLLEGLSQPPVQVLKNQQAYFAVYDKEDEVLSIEQNQEALKKLAPYDVVVTAPSSKYDFISRYFWPANGGEEDPVTGSIHSGLVPYWASKLHKTDLIAYQASKRGGVLHCKLENEGIAISGKCVQYLVGTITVNG